MPADLRSARASRQARVTAALARFVASGAPISKRFPELYPKLSPELFSTHRLLDLSPP